MMHQAEIDALYIMKANGNGKTEPRPSIALGAGAGLVPVAHNTGEVVYMRRRTRRWEPWKVEYISEREKFQAQQLYYNNLYHVFVRRYRPEGVPHDVIHLSIRNNDRSARHDWRDFQRIKNEIAGPQVEMVEMYPREDNKVDLSNQYHLWGFDTSEAVLSNVGLGFKEGRKVWNGLSARPAVPDTEKAVQRPNLEEDSTI